LLPGGTFVQERRWVSAVFFDLSRFTEYALAHPLEDTWQAANTALQTAANHVRLYGGHIDKFFGDGFLAVFGVPRSQESDARAALEAAHAMVSSSTLPGRAGVASGLVLRTPLGGGLAGDQTVLGPAVNLSQRLSQAAPPGEVWCDATTMRLVPGVLTEALSPQPLKGYAEPLVPFRYLGLRSDPPDALGRDREVGILHQALEAVRSGAGRRVVLYGPMGVGKSHLAQHFVETLPEGVRGVVAPRLTTGVALRYALRQGLQKLLIDGLSRLRQLELPEHLRTILDFSIGIEEHPGLPADELDNLLVQTWRTLLARIAQDSPIVVVLEDLHNADPTVLEFTRQPAPPGVMLLLIARQNRWEANDDLIPLLLEPLSLEDTQHLILRARPDLGPATSLHLAEASGGYPLAVQALSLTSSGEPEPIPLYQPRLDSLPRLARVALQAAAVLGSTAPPELVRHLVGEEADLTRLVGEGFLEADEQGQLRFAIPWLREATLGQVGGQQVQNWHQQAARWYQRQGRLAEAATHLEASGDTATAYRMWRVVAQQAWNEERYSGAILGYLEALRLAEGNVRWQAALEAAEAHLALGRYAEALDLANLPLESPDLPVALRQRVWAIRLEASLALGQADLMEPPTPEEIVEPRLALALARTVPIQKARVLLAGLPANLEGTAFLVRARALLRSGAVGQAQLECEVYLNEHARNPAECFEARQLLSEILWRQFKLGDALKALGQPPGDMLPAWFSSLYKSSQAALRLDLGELESAATLLEESLLLLEGAPTWVIERVSCVRLRFLLESGQLDEALYFGESAVAKAPSPRLLSHLALAYALAPGQQNELMLQRLVRGLEGTDNPEVEAVCELAWGLRKWNQSQDGAVHLRKAALLARRCHSPVFYFYALLALGLAQQTQNPKRALALSQYLLSQTAGRGFEVQHGYSRLLRAQLLLAEGREPSGLLEFEAITPLAQLWKTLLVAVVQGKKPALKAHHFRGHGILGNWARWYFGKRVPFLGVRSELPE
jgi:class 3 adenylate cyclase/tetratricopeptide (TPR) repeat protein